MEYDLAALGGKEIGVHKGAHFYTIGQRKGLNIGGTKEPLYVVGTDTETNTLYVGEGKEHPALYRTGLFVKNDNVHWIREDLSLPAGAEKDYDVRIRYRQKLQKASIFRGDDGLYITFDEPQRGVTPGQFAAWYSNDELLGSGVIE